MTRENTNKFPVLDRQVQNKEAHQESLWSLRPLALALAAALGAPVWAAEPIAAPLAAAESEPVDSTPALDAVTVRSRNRIERLQDVPVSISVVQGATLERLSATGIDAITKRAANVSWNLGNQRTSSLSIRGIGKIGQTEAQDPSVGIIVDGVSYAYNALTSSFDFIDIDTIEVARGPQGTLLGKNASVGSIIFNYRKPSFTPTADFSVEFREGDGLLATAAVGGPVVDGLLAWRGTFSVNRGTGDVVNQYNKDITYTNKDRVSGRVQFLLTPSEDLKARLALDLQPRAGETTNGRTVFTPTPTTYANGSANTALDNAGRLSRRWFIQNDAYSVDDYYATLSNDNQRPLVTGSRGATAEVNWRVGGGHTLTSITAYKDYHFDAVNDEGTPFDVYRNSGGFWNDYKQVSQELRLSSAAGGFVDYQGGLYAIQVDNDSTYSRRWGNDAGAWFATDAQYKLLDTDGAGRTLLVNSLANLDMAYNSPAGVQKIRNKSLAAFAQANWHFTDQISLTTGARLTHEERRNNASSVIFKNGSGGELNPVSVTTGAGTVQLGGFSTTSTGTLDNTNTAAQIALANATAVKYFGVASYSSLSANQLRQIAAAKALRKTAIGVVYNDTAAQPFKGDQPAVVISPSYKFSPQVTGYLAYQHGEKAGISQLVNGASGLVKGEKTNAFELGLKSGLFDKTLILNADVFLARISDYQQSVRVVDQYSTDALNGTLQPGQAGYQYVYTSATGNVPKVQASGLEVDGVYGGIPNTQITFSGAYNKAVYKRFPNAAQPSENGFAGAPAYRDLSGLPLAGAPKYTFNVGGDYRLPVLEDKEFHTSANVAVTSSYYSDTALSAYSVIPKNAVVDAAIGLGSRNKSFDVSLIVKNLFSDDTPQSKTWNSYAPAVPRVISLQFTAKL